MVNMVVQGSLRVRCSEVLEEVEAVAATGTTSVTPQHSPEILVERVVLKCFK